MKLSELVKARRLERGLSQQELARRLKISKAGVSSIEIGRTKSLRGPTLAGLMRELGISAEELAGQKRPTGARLTYTASNGGPNGRQRQRGVAVVGTAKMDTFGVWLSLAMGLTGGVLDFPSEDEAAYSVQINGDALHPRIKSGEFIVLEPGHEIEPGDEVLVRLKDGRSMIRELAWHREGQLALNDLGSHGGRMTIAESDVDTLHFVAAIVKASRFRET